MPRVLDATTEDVELAFSYGVAPRNLRLSPESRSAIRQELFSRLSRNEALREESLNSAAGAHYINEW